MNIEYSVFMYNAMCKHLDNIPKKLNIYRLVRIFYNKEELNVIIIKIAGMNFLLNVFFNLYYLLVSQHNLLKKNFPQLSLYLYRSKI